MQAPSTQSERVLTMWFSQGISIDYTTLLPPTRVKNGREIAKMSKSILVDKFRKSPGRGSSQAAKILTHIFLIYFAFHAILSNFRKIVKKNFQGVAYCSICRPRAAYFPVCRPDPVKYTALLLLSNIGPPMLYWYNMPPLPEG